MQIEFTDFAKSELQDIYDYYVIVASEKIALKIINKILSDIERLSISPDIGTKETLLEALNKSHLYIVCGNYKIIYYKTHNTIYVTDIFDCRQNPEKVTLRNE